MLFTTLNQIRAHGPCESGWKKLTAALGEGWGADDPLPIARIVETNGLQDALWALRAVPSCERLARLFACACAERVLLRERAAGREPDARSWAAVDVARRHADGQSTDEELAAAWAAARDAAWAAARAAAWDAAGAAARDAAWDAARAAARAAAGDSEIKEQTRILLEMMDEIEEPA